MKFTKILIALMTLTALYSYAQTTKINLNNQVQGILATANGGTGASGTCPSGAPQTGFCLTNTYGYWSQFNANNTIGLPSNYGSNNWVWQIESANYTLTPTVHETNVVSKFDVQNSFTGGSNYDGLGYINKINWMPHEQILNGYATGQHINSGVNVNGYGDGDVLLRSEMGYCFGGRVAGGDEGCETSDTQLYAGSVEYAGTVASVSGSNITISPSQGAGTQGVGRYLIDTSQGITAGTISNITSSGGLNTITGNVTSWPVSTVYATLGTAVSAPGSATVTPTSYSIGSISNITTSTLLCVQDQYSFEMVYPTSVSGSSFTATFFNPHSSSATVSGGGLCGYLFYPTADNVTSSTFSNTIQTITGTLRFGFPIVVSTSSTSAAVWIDAVNNYSTYLGQWNSTNNAYSMFPGARVASVNATGTNVNNTLTLGPNKVTWNSSDNVELPTSSQTYMNGGEDVMEKYYPAAYAASYRNLILNGIWTGDRIYQVANNTPASLYQANGGPFVPPYVHYYIGEFRDILYYAQEPDSYLFEVGCKDNPCDKTFNLFGVHSASGSVDTMSYNEVTRTWSLSSTLSVGTLLQNGLAVPTLDAAGNLAVTGSISASNGALSIGTYANDALHSLFDNGATGWPQRGGSTATITTNQGIDWLDNMTAEKVTSPAATGSSVGQAQTTGLTMLVGHTYQFSIYAQGAVGGELFTMSLHTSDTACRPGHGTFPSVIVLTTSLELYSGTCSPTSSESAIPNYGLNTSTGNTNTIYISQAQVCEVGVNCGVQIITTTSAITGTGQVSNGVPVTTVSTLTTTGTSGPATLTGSTLNIPQYSSAVIPSVLCRQTTDSSNTTQTTEENLFTCTIPSGTLGANSTLELSATYTIPANTGTCTFRVELSSSSTAGSATGFVISSAVAASRTTYIAGKCSNRNSVSSQMCSGTYTVPTNTTSSSNHTSSINTSTTTAYLLFTVVNSASGDTCTLSDAEVMLWP